MQRKAIFLDRDGVLNAAIVKNNKPYPPASLEELTIPADVFGALTRLKSLGFLLIGATNQPDVARGITKKSVVDAINAELIKKLPLHEIRVCFHDDVDHCNCRKPAPGLLLDAAKEYFINLEKSFMIGDRYKDIEAGKRAGCKTIWINRNYAEKSPEQVDFIASSLEEAASWIMGKPSHYIF
jgi:D-glycero-D-manno-heptose 1,7-bisphosphate phosphatase